MYVNKIFNFVYRFCFDCLLGFTSNMPQYRQPRATAVTTWLMKDGRYACPYGCGRTYKRKGAVSQHLKYECGVEPKFKCDICDKKFSHKSQMKGHMINIHKTLPINIWNTLCELFTHICIYCTLYIKIID